MSSKEKVDIKTLLEAGAHFGHRTSRWNPKMKPYIYTKRGGIHIIDLVQTAELMQTAYRFAESVAASGKQVLFVGTKKHIAPTVKATAESIGMPYVNQRWFGGILTNFDTISTRIKHYRKLTEDLAGGELADTYNKREIGEFQAERDKLSITFAGIAAMEKVPGALFVTDVATEKTAVREANRLNIPVIGIVDSNADPTPIDYVIPANDDAVKTVALIADYIAAAITEGTESFNKKPKNKDKDKDKDKDKKKPAKQTKKTAATKPQPKEVS